MQQRHQLNSPGALTKSGFSDPDGVFAACFRAQCRQPIPPQAFQQRTPFDISMIPADRVARRVGRRPSWLNVLLHPSRDYSALLHESSLARTMPTGMILTCRCDMTLVGRGRSSD